MGAMIRRTRGVARYDGAPDHVAVTEERSGVAPRPGLALWSGAAVLAAAAALPVARSTTAASLTCAAFACVLAILLARWAARRDRRPESAALLATAGVWAGLAGWVASLMLDRMQVVALAAALGCAAAAIVLGGRWSGTGRALGTAALTVAAAAALVAVWQVLGSDVWQAVRLLPAAVVVGVGLLPRYAVGAGGMAQAAFRVRVAGRLVPAEVDRLVGVAREHLLGGLAGLGAVAAGCACALVTRDDIRDVALAVGYGLLLTTRARLFDGTGQRLALRATGSVVLLAAAARLLTGASTPPQWWSGWLLPAALTAVAAMTVVAATRTPRSAGRGVRWVELALAAATLVALVVATGAADRATGLLG